MRIVLFSPAALFVCGGHGVVMMMMVMVLGGGGRLGLRRGSCERLLHACMPA